MRVQPDVSAGHLQDPADYAPPELRNPGLEIRLDAVVAVVLDGLSYRRAEPMVGICKTEVGASLDLLVPGLAALGHCQPDRPARDRAPVDACPARSGSQFNGPEPALIDELSWCFLPPGGC